MQTNIYEHNRYERLNIDGICIAKRVVVEGSTCYATVQRTVESLTRAIK